MSVPDEVSSNEVEVVTSVDYLPLLHNIGSLRNVVIKLLTGVRDGHVTYPRVKLWVMQESRHLVLATVIGVRDGHVTYPSCVQCYSKLFSDCTQNSWRCNKCGTSSRGEELEWRYRLALTITDHKSICNICVFGRLLEPAFGISASKFYKCYKHLQNTCSDAEEVLISALKQVFIGKCYYFGLKTQLFTSKQRRKPVNLQDIIDSYKVQCTSLTQPENDWRTEHHTDIIAYQMIPAVAAEYVLTVVEVLDDILHPELQSVPVQSDPVPVENGSVNFSRIYADSFSRSKLSDFTKNSQDSFGQSTALLSCDLTNSRSTLSNLGHSGFSFSKNTPREHENKIQELQVLSELPPLSDSLGYADSTTRDFHSQGYAETFCDEKEQCEPVSTSASNENLSSSFSNDTSSLLLSFPQQLCEDDKKQILGTTDKSKTGYSDRKIIDKQNHKNDVKVVNIKNKVSELTDVCFVNKIRPVETLTNATSTNKAGDNGELSTLECEDNFEGNDGSFIQEFDSHENLYLETACGLNSEKLDEYDETDKEVESDLNCMDGYINQQTQEYDVGSYFDADITSTLTGQVIATNDNDVSVSSECFLSRPNKRLSDADAIIVSKVFDKTMPDSEDLEEYLNSSEYDKFSQDVFGDNCENIKKVLDGTAKCQTNLKLGNKTKDYESADGDEVNVHVCIPKRLKLEDRTMPALELNGPVCSLKKLKLEEKTMPCWEYIKQGIDGNEASDNDQIQSQEKPRFKEGTMTVDVKCDTYLKPLDVDDLENIFNDSFNEEVSKIEDNILLTKHGTSNFQGHLLSKPLDLYKSHIESQIVLQEKLSQLRNISLSDNALLTVDMDEVYQGEAYCLGMESSQIVQDEKLSQLGNTSLSDNAIPMSIVDKEAVEQTEDSCLGMESCHIVQEEKLTQLKNISLSSNDVIRTEDVSPEEDSCFGNGSADLFALSDISNCSNKNISASTSRSGNRNEYSNCFKTPKSIPVHDNYRPPLFVLDETENLSLCSNSSTGCTGNKKSQLLNETTDISQPSQSCRAHVLKEQFDNSLQGTENKDVLLSDVSRKQNFKSVQFARRLSSFKSVQLIDLQMKLKQKYFPVITEYQTKSYLKEPMFNNGFNSFHKEPVLMNGSNLQPKKLTHSNDSNPHLKDLMCSNDSNPSLKEPMVSNGSSTHLKELTFSNGSNPHFKKPTFSNGSNTSLKDSMFSNGSNTHPKEPMLSYGSNQCLKELTFSNGSKDHKNILLPLQNMTLNSSQDEIFMSQDLFTPSPVNKTTNKENCNPKNKLNGKKRKSYSVCVSTPKSVVTPTSIINTALQSGSEPLFSDSFDNCSCSVEPRSQTSLSGSTVMDANCNDRLRIIPSENSVKLEEQNGNDILIESPCLFSQSEDLFSETKEDIHIKQCNTDKNSCCCEKTNSLMSTGNNKGLLCHNSVEFSPDLFNSDAELESPLSVPGEKPSLKTFPVKRLFLDK